ncbi:hypothetical protein AUP68_05450 [Ilyonectria robusta]
MLCSEIRTGQCGLLGVEPAKVERLLTAKLAKFVIGRNKIEFCVHTGLLSCLSARLRSLIEDSQAKEDYVHMEDVDDDVFLRFAQFAYCGSYAGFDAAEEDLQQNSARASTRGAIERQSDSTHSTDVPGLAGGTSCLFGQPLSKQNTSENAGEASPVLGLFGRPLKKQKTSENTGSENTGKATSLFGQRWDKQDTLKLPFSLASCTTTATDSVDDQAGCYHCSQDTLDVRVPSKRKQRPKACPCDFWKSKQPGKNQELTFNFMRTYAPGIKQGQNVGQVQSGPQSEHFKHVLIGHVRIWAFARRYAVGSLMDLTCANLVRELVYWVMSAQTFVPIFGELVRFVYGICTVEGDKLRLLVAQFAACVVGDISHLEGWHELLTEIPAFAVDLVHKLANRCL